MHRTRKPARGRIAAPAVAALLGVLAACSRDSRPLADPALPVAATTSPSKGEHDHQPGAHLGLVVPVGRDEYHLEAVFENGGRLRLYMLSADETRIAEVEKQDLTAYVRVAAGTESQVVVLTSEPIEGDAAGMTSRFSGTLPPEVVGRPVSVTIPALRIGGERFLVRFTTVAGEPENTMPAGVADEVAERLYLIPGGIYTAGDIDANGRMTAAAKYQGFRARHDFNPVSGDKICPITRTKANPDCRWIVGGQAYEFCCPPCIDEFLSLAKEDPSQILPADQYRKE